MFIELIDSLRCPRAHEDSWLVGSFDRMVGRRVVSGRLGCPVCRAEYPIVGGVAHMEGAAEARPDTGPDAATRALSDAVATAPGEEEVLRLAALLNLIGAGGLVVLQGDWAAVAAPLAELADVLVLVVDPHGALDARALPEAVSVLCAAGALPLAANAARGVALAPAAGGAAAPPLAAEGSVRALRSHGRLVAGATTPLPVGVTELARDARHWVAERDADDGAPVAIAPRPRRA